MPIFLKGKAKYIKNLIDGTEHCLTTGHFLKFLKSKGIESIADYVIAYECPNPRPVCQACGKFAKQEGVDGINWKFASTCGDEECAIEMRRLGRKAVTKAQEAESIRKRNETFAKEPNRFKNMQQRAHEANLKIGEDGLTGYERAALKRRQTLTEKYGRPDFANWQKTKQTWEEKTDEEIKGHGKKVREAWENKSQEQKKDEILRREKTKLQKYGIPGWKIAFNGSRGRRSKLSDNFCAQIQQHINEPLIFGSQELNLNNNFYDLTHAQTKKIIEFNGDYWHANPEKYSSDQIVSMKGGRSAQQIWEADAKKIAIAEQHGYQVKIVWESEYKKNPEHVIKDCIEWLNS